MTTAQLQALIERRGVHPVFGDAGEGYGIEQSPAELAAFLARMSELGVKSVLEIGTGHRAGLTRFLAHDMGWEVTTVDIVDYGHRFEGVNVIVLGHPSDRWTHQLVVMGSSDFDLVFVDGNHSYMSVKHDHESYGQMLATRAIAFHDIAGLRDCEGARDYWREIAYDGAALRDGYHEAIDAGFPAGIGWIEL